jgi:hypothetical protein
MRRSFGAGCGLLVLLGLLSALPAGRSPLGRAGAADAPDKVGTVHLFNGRDLTNFYTYLGAPDKGSKPYGKNNDPDKVFTVQDGRIRVSGKVFGGLITEKEYENYHLVVEYAWGEQTWPPRVDRARDSGILLHCVGEDGAASGVWMESIECQMIEGGTGDFILVKGKKTPSLTVTAVPRPTGEGKSLHKEFYFEKGAPPMPFTGGRINWTNRDPLWKDVKGFRGKKDVEKAVGEWNTLECVCDGKKISIRLNGTLVNEGTDASHARGKILFQSEGAEVFFRKIDLKPLPRK